MTARDERAPRLKTFTFWTGAIVPRYRFYRECLTIPARFYCKQIDWLWWRVMWGLNHD